MAETILTVDQTRILDAISRDPVLCRHFYLGGGTALAEFYLHHRLSEDLDFFSEKEFNPQIISVWLKKHANELKIKKVDFQQSFNRNLYFLHLRGGEVIKTEFTYYPFPRIAKQKKLNRLAIDSLEDIAVNKIFTVYQKPRARDFIDLYFIMTAKKWNLETLVKKAKVKFDWHIDYLQLGSQLLQVEEVKDYPKMIKKITPQVWQKFFISQAKKIGKRITE